MDLIRDFDQCCWVFKLSFLLLNNSVPSSSFQSLDNSVLQFLISFKNMLKRFVVTIFFVINSGGFVYQVVCLKLFMMGS